MNIFLHKIIIVLAKVWAVPAVFILSLAGYTVPLTNTPVTPAVRTIERTVVRSVYNPLVNSTHEKEGGNTSQNLGAFNPTGAATYFLQGGVTTTATSIYLTSFKEPISNFPYTMTYLNSNIEYATIDPQIPSRTEFISFSGITQNSDGSAVLTGIVRGLMRSYPYTASTTMAKTHAAQAQLILSDAPQVFVQYPAKQNDETITGNWFFPEPVNASSTATKNYVLSVLTGTSTIATDKLVVAGTAGETVAAGNVVSLNTNGQWYKTNANTSSSTVDTIVGVAQGAGTVGVTISGGVLLRGLDTNQANLVAGQHYFASTTSGTLGRATTTKSVGRARTTTAIYVDPGYIDTNKPELYAANVFTSNNTFSATTTLASSTLVGNISAFDIGKHLVVITATTSATTFTPVSGVTVYDIQCVGAGGGGGGSSSGNSAGGGAGAYFRKMVYSSSTILTIAIGTGGAGGAAGGANTGTVGGDTTVSSVIFATLTAGGGGGGGGASGAGGTSASGGTATNGDINIRGGGSIQSALNVFAAGGSSFFGGPASTADLDTSGTKGAYGSGGVPSVGNQAGARGTNGACIIQY